MDRKHFRFLFNYMGFELDSYYVDFINSYNRGTFRWRQYIDMTGKDKIFNYCNTLKTHSVDALEVALEIVSDLKHNKIPQDHCPTSWGLKDGEWIGLCNKEDVGYVYEAQDAQCKKCWEGALALEIKEESVKREE